MGVTIVSLFPIMIKPGTILCGRAGNTSTFLMSKGAQPLDWAVYLDVLYGAIDNFDVPRNVHSAAWNRVFIPLAGKSVSVPIQQ